MKLHTVNYLDNFWINLYWDGRLALQRWSHRPKIITVRFRFIWAVLPLLQLFPHTTRVVYADPILPPHPTFSTLKPITMPSVSSQEPLETVFVSKLRPYGTYINSYVSGQCTWYVASRLQVPNWGNAISWGYAAAVAGYTISDTPKPGAIAWSVTDSYLGHVAVVEDDGVTISEMNYHGPYSMDSRIPNPGEFRYIYL